MFDPRNLFVNTPRHSRLQDGSYCRIRPLSARDRHLLIEFFEHWSPDSRRMRFLGAKRKLTEGDLDFFTSADGLDHIAFVAIRLGRLGDEAEPLGFARCLRLQAKEFAEMSVAVADGVQRQGVGSALLGQLTRSARYAGIRHFVCEALADNPGMRALASQRGGSARRHEGGTVEYEWPLPVDMPTAGKPWSIDPQEALEESVAFWSTMIDQILHIGFDFWSSMRRLFTDPVSLADMPFPGYRVTSFGTSVASHTDAPIDKRGVPAPM